MTNQISEVAKNFGVVSNLEKAQELRVALLVFAFTMFVDLTMLNVNGKGLCDLYANFDIAKVNLVPELIIIFVFFSLFMATGMPIFSEMMRIVFVIFFQPIWYRITGHAQHNSLMSQLGFVRLYTVSEKAHSSKEEYFLELEKEAKEQKREGEMQHVRLFVLSISCFVLSACDLLWNRASHVSLLQCIEKAT